MEIKRGASAGSVESSDVFVGVEPGEGIHINVESVVYEQFGKELEKNAAEALALFGVKNATIIMRDSGALECTVRARLETALRRACGEE